MPSTKRTQLQRVHMTRECVRAESARNRTPRSRSPFETPVATTITSCGARSSIVKTRSVSAIPWARASSISARRVGHSCACSSPPRQRSAAAARTACRVPPIPIARWSFVPRTAALIDAVTSPSWISLIRAPAARISSIRSWWRGRSSTIAVMSLTMRPNASAIARMLSPTGLVSSIFPRAGGPTAIFRMYMSGREGIDPRGAAAIMEIALVPPRATTARPSSGSSARSNSSPPAPTSVPAASCSASSGPPITMRPLIGIRSSATRAPENAASSAALMSARPSQRAPASAARSVTRANVSHWHCGRSCSAVAGSFAFSSVCVTPSPASARRVHDEADHRVDRPLDVRILDDGHALAPRAAGDVGLDAPDVVQAVEVLLHRAAPARRAVADVEVHLVHLLVRDLEHDVHEDRALELPREEAGNEVHPLQDHRPALGERPVESGVHADADVAALVDEADDRRVARHLLVQGRARLEAREVDRRHELRREERAHRLPDEVGRRDAVDPEPVRDLDGDRRLARPGGAADQHDDRQVEVVELRQPAQPADGLDALGLAEHLAREHLEPLERDRPLACLGEVELDPARELVGLVGRHPGGDQRARHQALRIRELGVAERQRVAVARLRAHGTTAGTRPRSASSSTPITSVAARTTSIPRSSACAATTSIAAAFTSTRYVSASTRSCRSAPRSASRGETRTTSASRCETSVAPAVKTATRPWSGAVGRRRSSGCSTPTSETSRRYVSRYGSRCRSPVTSTRREVATGGMAAPLPSNSTTSAPSSAARRAPSPTFETATPPASPPPARRQPIVGTPVSAASSRWSDAAWRPLRASATRSSTVGGVSTSSGSGGPPRPIATTTTRRSRASSRARCAVTAVFPTRFPVPITEIDGRSKGSSRGGSKRKSAPTYGSPAASARDAHSIRSGGPSTGSSDRSTTTSAAPKSARSGTP